MRSLLQKIFLTFLILIIITAFFHSSLDYYTSYKEIPHLLTRIETDHIAGIIGNFHDRKGSWSGLEEELVWFEQGAGEDGPSLRIIVRDGEGRTIYNSFSRLEQWDSTPLVEGSRRSIYAGGFLLGTVTTYLGKDYLNKETRSYLSDSLMGRLLWGLAMILVVFSLAFLFSRSLIRPVRALTEGMERISREGTWEDLSVQSRDELGRMSRAFNEMTRALEEQKGLRKKLVDNLSHDIGTPLNSIRLEARGIGDKLTSPEKGARRIVEEVDRLKGMLTDLDWLAETDSGVYKLVLTRDDPRAAVREEAERWRIRAESRDISLEIDTEGEPFSCLFDRDRIGRALGNLLENSIKYTPEGGGIRVSCRVGVDSVTIAVEDNGQGIEEEVLPYVFERFYRADRSRARGGRGLGLSIVKQIIELHGGDVSALSEPGRG
ncbi:MAG: HAMP domain-containing histidine kinase, partial [Spirochaetales bacterium]|nr:HAMP domain-containing histidine kinase [Spirochaetales bacterium]